MQTTKEALLARLRGEKADFKGYVPDAAGGQ